MSREIKFRAWTGAKMMGLNPPMDAFALRSDGMVSGNMQVELMQFTGLKDCNEVDVYEGDIVQATIGEMRKYEIVFDGSCFCLGGNVNMVLQVNGMSHASHIKIIGNIHESPELLGDA